MKFRTILLASAAVMFTSSAFAADITNPFFLPTQGKILSDTSIETTRTKTDTGVEEGVSKGLYAVEEITVGLTDNLALVGNIGNHFDYDKDDEFNNDHNFEYAVGAKYNMNFGKIISQIGVAYTTHDAKSWYGYDKNNDSGRWDKALAAEVKVGYAFDCGLTPYTSLGIMGDIDKPTREQAYSWFLGAHKAWDKASADLGVRYNWSWVDATDDTVDGDAHIEVWNLEAEANYFVTENFTVGAYGEYYLGGTARKDIEYDYTFGLNAKVLF